MKMEAARPTYVHANTGESFGMTHRGAPMQVGEQGHFHLKLDTMKAQSGFTLIELMVVVTIIGIFLAIATLNFTQWNDKYTVESYTKEIHSILMRARNDAANTNTQRLVTLAANQVQIVQDINGNSVVDAGEPTITNPYPRFTIQSTISPIVFDRRGIANLVVNQSISIIGYSPNASPGVDCIVVFATRINMGRWDSTQPVGQQCVQQ
jgi:prepilin-type N-terminal cleavage/methylation domain-containing protein